jgi:hypothetical protein
MQSAVCGVYQNSLRKKGERLGGLRETHRFDVRRIFLMKKNQAEKTKMQARVNRRGQFRVVQ